MIDWIARWCGTDGWHKAIRQGKHYTRLGVCCQSLCFPGETKTGRFLRVKGNTDLSSAPLAGIILSSRSWRSQFRKAK